MFARHRYEWLALGSVAICTVACMDVVDGPRQVDDSSEALTASSLELDVSLRDNGSAKLHASVFTGPCALGETILAVHGLAETGFTFEPLATALLRQQPQVKRVIAIDLIGHGDSGYPQGLSDNTQFGDLMIEDNASVVIQVIDALRDRELGPSTIIAHSLGGLEVQTAQESLLSHDSSLAQHGVRRVLMLAPVPPHGRPWDEPTGVDVSSLVVQDEQLGSYVSIPPALWLAQAFSTLAGTLVPDAPTPEEVVERQYIAPEPLFTELQLLELPIPQPDGSSLSFPRPSVREHAFAPIRGTRLTLVSFAQDTLVPAANLRDLYDYLTGDASRLHYVEVNDARAVHSSFISEPQPILQALRWRSAL